MLHHLPENQLGPHGEEMAHAIHTCVHCGFCLPACPTYQELGQEMDSPRGRIILMKGVLEGEIPAEQAMPYIDRCLGCLACEPACPSGVPYRDLISPFRAKMEQTRRRPWLERLKRLAITTTLPSPETFKRMAGLGKFAKPFTALMPKVMRPMMELLPDRLPEAAAIAPVTPAIGEKRGRVALLTGCAQSVLEPAINESTIDVLSRNGVEVIIPQNQVCCGSLAWHVGDLESAKRYAIRNIEAFPADVDAIVTNAAGCGSGMHEYGLMLRGTQWEKAAQAFADRTMDVSVYLDRLGFTPPPALKSPLKVAYQDACHLRNAQGVIEPPRALLQAVGNLELLEIPDGALCCGSAGTYNVDQPEIASALGRRKIEAILATGAEVVVSGNIGCITQMKHHARKLNAKVRITHTMQLLSEIYG